MAVPIFRSMLPLVSSKTPMLTGRSVDIVFSRFQPGRCYYDIKVIDANDVDGYLWSVDLCSTNSVTFH